jgi:hypothetical protein
MIRYGVPAVTSPEARRPPMIASAPNRPLPRVGLVVAGTARLITFSGPVNADCVSRGVRRRRREGAGAGRIRPEEGESG